MKRPSQNYRGYLSRRNLRLGLNADAGLIDALEGQTRAIQDLADSTAAMVAVVIQEAEDAAEFGGTLDDD